MIFTDPESEADFKAKLLRRPESLDALEYMLLNRKKDMDMCEACETIAEKDCSLARSSLDIHDRGGIPQIAESVTTVLLPELLAEIFLFLSAADPPRIQENWDISCTKILATPYLGWINVTRVCRRWRHIAVGAAILWADFGHGFVLGPSWTQEFISRAKFAAISVPRFDDYPKIAEMISDYVWRHHSHIRSLSLSTEWCSHDVVSDVSLLYSTRLVSAYLDSGIGKFPCPEIFGGYAPKLRYLKICNVVPWISHTIFWDLLELDVFLSTSKVPDPSQGEVEPVVVEVLGPYSQVLDVLAEASMLERLSLHYAIPPDDPICPDLRKVHFPRLRSFSMSSKVFDCVSFFKNLALPSTTMLDLTCIPGLFPEKFRELFFILADRFRFSDNESSHLARLELGTGKVGDKILLRAYADIRAMSGQNIDPATSSNHVSSQSRLSPSPFITLSLAYASAQEHIDVFRAFFAIMPLHELSYLSVQGCWLVDPHGWRTIIRRSFADLHSVRFLVLGQDCAQYFFHAIHDEKPSAVELHPPAIPGLDTLVLRNVDFSMFSYTFDEVPFQEQMLYDLRDRARRGSKLRVLYFISCQGIAESWVASLKEVVRFVVSGF